MELDSQEVRFRPGAMGLREMVRVELTICEEEALVVVVVLSRDGWM